MKTLKSLIAALLIFVSYTSFADGKPAGEPGKKARFAKLILPAMPVTIGSPDDINSEAVEALKNIKANGYENDTAVSRPDGTPVKSSSNLKLTIAAPEMIWGNPEDVNIESIRSLKFLKFPAPEMIWGNAEELKSESVESLKYLNFPTADMNWGSPDDVHSDTVKSLKYLNFSLPEMIWGDPQDAEAIAERLFKDLN
ncbi:hypothetical protein [Daejeonella oryzae]|uniref:hypothetical protein n=1 Tax=Daejeonella oryzae TaxID=1122943 RepID=UPI0004135916|nr:hypothetical protein [Daejeonella oryzae]